MKVLLINGSPRVGSNTSIALGEMEKIFQQEGIQVDPVDAVPLSTEYLQELGEMEESAEDLDAEQILADLDYMIRQM